MFGFRLPLLNGLEVFLLFAVWKTDRAIGKVPRKADEGGHLAKGNVFLDFPQDAQMVPESRCEENVS